MNQRLEKLVLFYSQNPHDAFINYALAHEYHTQNDTQNALKHYQYLTENRPDYLPTYYQLGKLYEQLNQTQNAIDCYNKGITIANQQNDTKTKAELNNAKINLEIEG